MYNGWFDNSFLASAFTLSRKNGYLWLSQKQTKICLSYMQRPFAHSMDFSYKWRGMKVEMQYCELNRCGRISFKNIHTLKFK